MSRNEKIVIYSRDNSTGNNGSNKVRKSRSLSKNVEESKEVKDNSKSKVGINNANSTNNNMNHSKNNSNTHHHQNTIGIPSNLAGPNFNSLNPILKSNSNMNNLNKKNKPLVRSNNSFSLLNELCASADSPSIKKNLIVKKETFSPIKYENYQTSPSYNNNSGRIRSKTKNLSTCTSNTKIPIPSTKMKMGANLDLFFTSLDKYNRELEKSNAVRTKSYKVNMHNKILNFENIFNLPENSGMIKLYNETWNRFLSNIDTITAGDKDNTTNKNNPDDQDKNSEVKMKIYEKDQEIQELTNLIHTRDYYIKDLEVLVNDMNVKFCKNYMESIDNNTADEVNFYTHKQLLRDFKNLSMENKGLREVNSRLEKENNIRKEKEIKIMQMLYLLNKKGVNIDEMLGVQKNEDTDVSIITNAMDSSIYTPINIDPPKLQKKLDFIPLLNLTHINDQFNPEYIPNGNTQQHFNTVDNEDTSINPIKKLQLVSNLKNFKTKIFTNTDLKNKFKLNLNLQEKLSTEFNKKETNTHSTTLTTVNSPTNNNPMNSSSQQSSASSKKGSLKDKMKSLVKVNKGLNLSLKK